MNSIRPDIIAEVSLLPTDQGGKTKSIPPIQFGCPIQLGGKGFDCRLLLDQVGTGLAPGETITVPIKFLYPELARPRLKVGLRFTLHEIGKIGDGEILEILDPE